MNLDNIDQNTINNIKNMVDNGNIDGAISQISPEMIQNFSKMLSQANTQNSNNSKSQETSNNQNNGFDFNNIDINAVMKMASSFNNNQNDPRSNLLNSLKPYMRDSKKSKIDNYINLMNMSKLAEIFKNNPNINNQDSNKET